MRIAVFGATGRTGHPLVEQAVERGHEVVAFVRDVTGLSSILRNNDRVSIVEGDAYTGEGVDRAIAGDGDPVDAVVSVLGQTSDGPDDLLTEAGHHMLAAMRRHGVERVVTLVGAGVREDGESVSLGGRVMNGLLKLLAGAVLEDARTHVESIKRSDTRWTVVRGPRLTEDAHTGEFRHGTDLSLGMRDTAARANVAEFILDCLEADRYIRELPKVADAG
jgi:putative NADH-flavin reductase